MTGSNCIECLADVEVGSHSALHLCLEAGDRETESDGDRIDEISADVDNSINGSEEDRASRELGNCLAVCDIYLSDVEPVKEGTDAFSCLDRGIQL